jgi:hypothetical protein
MKLPLPSVFNSGLNSDYLQLVARWLLEELYATEDDLVRSTDNGYSIGCTTFMRQKNRIIAEATSGRYSWLTLSSCSNALVFNISGVPCRFSNDDPTNPSKDAVLTATRYQLNFLEFTTPGEPGRFCFIVDRGRNESAEPRVEFLGFAPSGETACRWVSDNFRVLRIETQESMAPTVHVAKPQIAPKRRDESEASSEALK